MDQPMTVKEIVRLIDWLKANGHDEKDAADCIKYIAKEPDTKQDK